MVSHPRERNWTMNMHQLPPTTTNIWPSQVNFSDGQGNISLTQNLRKQGAKRAYSSSLPAISSPRNLEETTAEILLT